MTFHVLEHNTRYPGLTGYYVNATLAAYQYMARLQSQGLHTSTTYHADGSISVESAGLSTLTFCEVQS